MSDDDDDDDGNRLASAREWLQATARFRSNLLSQALLAGSPRRRSIHWDSTYPFHSTSISMARTGASLDRRRLRGGLPPPSALVAMSTRRTERQRKRQRKKGEKKARTFC
jgi:hypothetical protein